MSRFRGSRRSVGVAVAAVWLAAAAVGAFAQASPPAPINGTITSIRGNLLSLMLADKSVKEVALQSGTLILERDVAAVEDLKAGEAMGVAARRSGADLIATSINIFSKEMWEGVRKGQWPMTTGETMTNAMVTDYAQGVNGRTITMKYQDVTATITVPDGVQIHRLVSVKVAALAVGMQVSVRGTAGADGTLNATLTAVAASGATGVVVLTATF